MFPPSRPLLDAGLGAKVGTWEHKTPTSYIIFYIIIFYCIRIENKN